MCNADDVRLDVFETLGDIEPLLLAVERTDAELH